MDNKTHAADVGVSASRTSIIKQFSLLRYTNGARCAFRVSCPREDPIIAVSLSMTSKLTHRNACHAVEILRPRGASARSIISLK